MFLKPKWHAISSGVLPTESLSSKSYKISFYVSELGFNELSLELEI